MYAAIVVGLYGDMPVQIDPDTVSFSESTGKPVDPPSLFEAQVQVRSMTVNTCHFTCLFLNLSVVFLNRFHIIEFRYVTYLFLLGPVQLLLFNIHANALQW